MRWRTSNNNRKKAERRWFRVGRYERLWPNLAANFQDWMIGWDFASKPDVGVEFTFRAPPQCR